VRAAALAIALALAGAASAEPPNPYTEGSTTIGVDGVSAPRSRDERIAWIRARLAEVVVYPKTALKNGVEGTSRIQFVVGPDGRAQEIRTVESSGHFSLDRAAEQSAIDAGQLPRIVGRLDVPIRFSLEDEYRRHRAE
jgi:periplasmic protein TonB